ncbi:MAG: VTT domain-containing protein [Candidatus Pacebacteria bacterium]|nr:VTT domain-containing protein [Candidatus Paceibacterota bacterium]
MQSIFNPNLIALIEISGYLGLFTIVFAESGLFFGFFLPGDSLLFTAGLLSSQGLLNIFYLVPLVVLGAILGDSVGYWFGKKVGPKIFFHEHSFLFNKRHLERTKSFYLKYGPRAIILARFVPIVRTFTPIFAGVGEMPYSMFLRYNVIGGVVWAAGATLLGYFLGAVIPNAENYLLPIVLVIIFVSFLPIIFEFWKNRK